MKVLITGAGGLVGKAVAAHCRALDDRVVGLFRNDLDITDPAAVAGVIKEAAPDAVINCAAYTDVDGAESNPDLCRLVNDEAVGNLAEASRINGCAFVTISTDFVFNGLKKGFYIETDDVSPVSVYGKTKALGEQTALRLYPDSVVVRTGWIFGSGGTNFLSVMHLLLGEGKRIKAIRDSWGTPTYAPDLAFRLRELAALGVPGIFHVTNSGEGTSYAGFANAMTELGGFDKSLVEEIDADTLERPAPRPRNSRLACLAAQEAGLPELPGWKDGLKRHLAGFSGSPAAG